MKKMNVNLKRLIASGSVFALLFSALLTVVAPINVTAQQAYGDNGTSTKQTPVFNYFYNVPFGVGNEADFVRLKPAAAGNAAYVSSLASACNVGDQFTVRTYIHNGADPNGNNNGTGIAVAKNTTVSMTADINKTATSFEFKSTVAATGVESVNDNAMLNCGGKTVKLKLVPKSVKTYSLALGDQPVDDTAVNSTIKIGSRVQGSGDVWACWPERVTVEYVVTVEAVTIDVCPNIPGDQATVPSGMTQDANGNCINTVISTGECRAVQINVEDARARRIGVNIDAAVDNGATVIGYRIDWGDGTSSDKQKDSHSYAKDGTYRVSASVQVRYSDGRTEWKTASGCMRDVTFSGDKTPDVTPIASTTVGRPSSLPVTGAAGLAGIFASVSTVATLAYSVVSRRFSKSA